MVSNFKFTVENSPTWLLELDRKITAKKKRTREIEKNYLDCTDIMTRRKLRNIIQSYRSRIKKEYRKAQLRLCMETLTTILEKSKEVIDSVPIRSIVPRQSKALSYLIEEESQADKEVYDASKQKSNGTNHDGKVSELK